MDDLFEKLKAEPPINKNISSAPPSPPPAAANKSLDEKLISDFRINENSSPRRESMPPPSSPMVIKASSNKSRSMSPPKFSKSGIKPFKVKIERKNLENLLNNSLHKKGQTNSKKATTTKSSTQKAGSSIKDEQKPKKTTTAKDEQKTKKTPPAKEKEEPKVKKMTPTKAQQKLFDPVVLLKAKQLKELKVKRCAVRLQRSNLKKLQTEFAAKQKSRKSHKKKAAAPKAGEKRKHNSSTILDSPPEKRGRPSGNSPTKDGKQKLGGFFIKLSSTTKQKTSVKKTKSPSSVTKDKLNKNRQPSYKTTTHKPTKFTRSQLIKTFGNRFFCSHVKIERCPHPLMLIFESNARARRLQAKRNQKSKNLSVSFKEQVEVFGNSDSDSDDEGDTASTSQAAQHKLHNTTTALVPVMPARLKKVENGKVIDDIEFDTSLFMDPKSSAAASSTPFQSPGRKKREKKSYSPLKGDGTPSPRKEQLKLANEKMPPSGLRRLNIDDDDDDDEDDDCEYIVPIDIPQRRTSRASSLSAAERSPATEAMDTETSASLIINADNAGQSPSRASMETDTVNADSARIAADVIDAAAVAIESSDSSFESAIDQTPAITDAICTDLMSPAVRVLSKEIKSSETNKDAAPNAVETLDSDEHDIIEDLSKHIDPSPVPSLNSIRDLVDSVINICADDDDFDVANNRSTTNATSNNNDNANANGGGNGNANIVPNNNDMHNNDDISLKLFVEENSECDGVSSDNSDIVNDKQQLRATTPKAVLTQSKVAAE